MDGGPTVSEPQVGDSCADVCASAADGEFIEVFARRVATVSVQVDGAGREDFSAGDAWFVGVCSAGDESCGTASTNLANPASLWNSLARARAARKAAPRPWSGRARAAFPDARPVDRHAVDRDAIDRLLRDGPVAVTATVRRLGDLAATAAPVRITAGQTVRHVLLYRSDGAALAYDQSEAQVHLRSQQTGLEAVQAARIRTTCDEVCQDELLNDFRRIHRHLSGEPVTAPRLSWILLGPIVVARILGRLAPFMINRPGAGLAIPHTIGSPAMTLVDDGTLAGAPATSPFDDEGNPRRRTTLVRDGILVMLLSREPTSTGNACWSGWESDLAAVPTNFYLEPTRPEIKPDLSAMPDAGIVAEEIRGFRSGISLSTQRIEFELRGGCYVEGRCTGTVRVNISATPREFLNGLRGVYAGTEFYRISGTFGGSWCEWDGTGVIDD